MDHLDEIKRWINQAAYAIASQYDPIPNYKLTFVGYDDKTRRVEFDIDTVHADLRKQFDNLLKTFNQIPGIARHDHGWGFDRTLYQDDACKVSKIYIIAGKSTDVYNLLHNTCYIVTTNGVVDVVVGSSISRLYVGHDINIKFGSQFRIRNIGKIPAQLIITCVGEYPEEL